MISAPSIRAAIRSSFFGLAMTASLTADNATFHRAVNLNGQATTIAGNPWEGREAPNLKIKGKAFENQSVLLRPPPDVDTARMIRTSVFGSQVEIEFTELPEGPYQLFVYVWEDNHSEQFDLLVNGGLVLEKAYTGDAGRWKRLGPWPAVSENGRIKISSRAPGHGGVNFSGVELWAGEGPLPKIDRPEFVTELTTEHVDFFERRIRPILAVHCFECHRAGAKKLGGNLLLDSRAGIMQGGETGPVITPGDPEASLLIHAVRHTDPQLTMPPDDKLPPEAIADLEQWVRMGAPDPRTKDTVATLLQKEAIDWEAAREWWSFRPVRDPAPPAVSGSEWPANDIDRFILARLEKEGISPASDAEKRALIRRATFDLIGLPPTPREVMLFLADESSDAFGAVVERLLASPHYGERWGRHWLDVVRYADTAGDNSDFPIPQMHRYRDWVIRAFNRDLPYDQFVREQLAGDLLPGESLQDTHDRLIATGYIANARRFGSRVEDYPQHLTIEDTIDNLGRSFLGLTVGCARCHDHKFDPVTSADYYALYGIFASTRYPWPGIELDKRQRDLVPLVAQDEFERLRNEHDEKKSRLERDVEELKESLKNTAETERKMQEQQLEKAELALKNFIEAGPPYELAYAVAETGRAGDEAIQIQGDPAKPGKVVSRRFLEVLGGQQLPSDNNSSGRLQLAEWIVASDNPLTARVMVNRIWQHHFGKGLVPTPNDFGKQGKPPTHPELLDWLATRFVESGWSIKEMHRLIMLSRSYRLAGTPGTEIFAHDAENHLLSAFPRRRLDAEAIRDTLLVLGGNLNTSAPGAHPFPPQSDWNFTQHNPFKAVYETRHRSVYLMTQRIQRHPYLAIFDGADPSASTPARTTSTTPLQALFLLNDPFVHKQAKLFAERIRGASEDDAGRLEFAYLSALGRLPQSEEIARSRQFLTTVRGTLREAGGTTDELEAAAWEAIVRVLFRLNEFVYVD